MKQSVSRQIDRAASLLHMSRDEVIDEACIQYLTNLPKDTQNSSPTEGFYDKNYYCSKGHWVIKGAEVTDKAGVKRCPEHGRQLRMRSHNYKRK